MGGLLVDGFVLRVCGFGGGDGDGGGGSFGFGWKNGFGVGGLLKDPLHVPVGPITRARSKKIKEALNGLIQDIWADSITGLSKLGPKEDEGVINLIQATDGADHA